MIVKFHIAAICNGYGCCISDPYTDYEKAIAYVYEYVKEWWDDVADILEMPDIPEDHQEAIKLYFSNHPEGESHTIELKHYVVTEHA